MEEQKLQEFLIWLPENIDDFAGMQPEQVAQSLNNLIKTDEGKQTLQTLWLTFEEQGSQKFALGGKLNYIISLHKEGGKFSKCKCGCTIQKIMKNGGIVEKCACGCKINKNEDGGIISNTKPNSKNLKPGIIKGKEGITPDESPKRRSNLIIPRETVGRFANLFGNGYKASTTTKDEKGKALLGEFISPKENKLIRIIERPRGHYVNRTTQVIKDFGTTKADTTYYSPKGNPFTPKQAPTWNNKFSEFFD